MHDERVFPRALRFEPLSASVTRDAEGLQVPNTWRLAFAPRCAAYIYIVLARHAKPMGDCRRCSRRKRTWLIAVGLTCGAAVVGALGGLLLNDSKADASAEWGKALLTLFVAILISGLLHHSV